MEMFEKRVKIINKLKSYFIDNASAIKQELNISVPKNIITISNAKFVAWAQVRSSKILMARNLKKCADLQDMIIDFIETEREVEIAENQIILSQQCV